MFLKSIELFGFKSFANRTKIEFCDGITAILGQNGCGKSNVVDAVKWVTASARVTKDLRIQERTDVIFGGTQEISAMNMAEVTLTFSNEERQLLFDDDEVVVRRRLYRSGENEYSINGKVATGKDLSALFLNTGIGKSAYSVMEQGRIDQVLSKRPDDRRYLFEEAAGIAGAKAEAEEAKKNLIATQENLSQLEITLSALKSRYETLEAQAKKAKKWRELKKSLFTADTALYEKRREGLEEVRTNGDKYYKSALDAQKAVENRIAIITKEVDEEMKVATVQQEKIVGLQKDLITASAKKDSASKAIASLQKQLSAQKSNLATFQVRLKELTERIEELEEDSTSIQESAYEKQKLLTQVKDNIAGYEKSLEVASTSLKETVKALTDVDDEKRELGNKKDALQKDLIQASAGMAVAIERDWKERGLTEKALETLLENLKSGGTGDTNALCNILEFVLGIVSDRGAAHDKRAIDLALEENRLLKDKCDKRQHELEEKSAALTGDLGEYRAMMGKLKVNEGQLEVALQYALQEKSRLSGDIARAQKDLSDCGAEIEQLEKKIESDEEELSEVEEEAALATIEEKKAQEKMGELGDAVTKSNDLIEKKREELETLSEELKVAREEVIKVDRQLAAIESQISNVASQYEEIHGKDLGLEVETLKKDDDKKDIFNKSEEELKKIKNETMKAIDNLGQVNLMAEGDFLEVSKEFNEKNAAIEDVKKACADLERVSQEIKTRAATMFMMAYNKISKGFAEMFSLLMGGGRARLSLTNPEDVLSSGIEIEAEPPGKSLQNLGLLSGGEKTMTAVALLFATYQAHPAPYCLLDEIDAALDDKNVASFASALKSFSTKTQYVVITHNKKTALAADSMFGVSMPVLGVSSVVSLRFSDYEIGGKD